MSAPALVPPKISVVILNYNGAVWLQRCFDSLRAQTIFPAIEVIVADNASADGSDKFAEEVLRTWSNGLFIQNGGNLGFSEGNNRGAARATGQFLFFLNNDTWLEPDCLEQLYNAAVVHQADGGMPVVLDYPDDHFQSLGASGFDWFGIPNDQPPTSAPVELFAAAGCSILVRSEMFRRVGGFDAAHFLYAEETDLSWRILIAGGRLFGVPAARMHHRGGVAVNPEGQTRVVESRTSETKRFLANRNGLLLLLKNAQHVLLLLVIPHLFLLGFEALVSLLLVRRWSYVRQSYVRAVPACWAMRAHVRDWRRRIRGFRQRGDFQMLRFLRFKPSRWTDFTKLLHWGVPKVDRR